MSTPKKDGRRRAPYGIVGSVDYLFDYFYQEDLYILFKSESLGPLITFRMIIAVPSPLGHRVAVPASRGFSDDVFNDDDDDERRSKMRPRLLPNCLPC